MGRGLRFLRSTVLAPNKERSLKFFLRTRSITHRRGPGRGLGHGRSGQPDGTERPVGPGRPAVDHGRGRGGCRRDPGPLRRPERGLGPELGHHPLLHPAARRQRQRQHDDPVLRRLPAGRLDPQPGLHHHARPGDRPSTGPTRPPTASPPSTPRSAARAWENTSASCTNATVNVTGQINFARAARGPKTTGTTLTFVPFGRDAVAYLYYDHGDGQPGHADHGPAEGPLLRDDHHHQR